MPETLVELKPITPVPTGSRGRVAMMVLMVVMLLYVLYHSVQEHRRWVREETWWHTQHEEATGGEIPVLQLKPDDKRGVVGSLMCRGTAGYHVRLKIVEGEASAKVVVFRTEPTVKSHNWPQTDWYVLQKIGPDTSTLYRLRDRDFGTKTVGIRIPTNLEDEHERIAMLRSTRSHSAKP